MPHITLHATFRGDNSCNCCQNTGTKEHIALSTDATINANKDGQFNDCVLSMNSKKKCMELFKRSSYDKCSNKANFEKAWEVLQEKIEEKYKHSGIDMTQIKTDINNQKNTPLTVSLFYDIVNRAMQQGKYRQPDSAITERRQSGPIGRIEDSSLANAFNPLAQASQVRPIPYPTTSSETVNLEVNQGHFEESQRTSSEPPLTVAPPYSINVEVKMPCESPQFSVVSSQGSSSIIKVNVVCSTPPAAPALLPPEEGFPRFSSPHHRSEGSSSRPQTPRGIRPYSGVNRTEPTVATAHATAKQKRGKL